MPGPLCRLRLLQGKAGFTGYQWFQARAEKMHYADKHGWDRKGKDTTRQKGDKSKGDKSATVFYHFVVPLPRSYPILKYFSCLLLFLPFFLPCLLSLYIPVNLSTIHFFLPVTCLLFYTLRLCNASCYTSDIEGLVASIAALSQIFGYVSYVTLVTLSTVARGFFVCAIFRVFGNSPEQVVPVLVE